MKPSRNYVTPFITIIFLAVGLSGVLMCFHLLVGYTEVVHEVLGMFFILCSIFHVILNWKALKIHFKKGVFVPALLAVAVISTILVISEIMYPPVDITLVNRLVQAPIRDALKALNVDYDQAARRLRENGISIEEASTMEAIWENNGADPEEVIDLIME